MNKIKRQNADNKPFSFPAIKVHVTVKTFKINQAIYTKNINIDIHNDKI